jgi:hypothetical protein
MVVEIVHTGVRVVLRALQMQDLWVETLVKGKKQTNRSLSRVQGLHEVKLGKLGIAGPLERHDWNLAEP